MAAIPAGGDRPAERGAVTVLAALTMAVVLIGASFSVDLGRQVLRGRDLRTVADLAALDAVRLLDGATTAALADAVDARAHAAATRNAAGSGPADLDVTLGTWDTATGAFTPTAPDAVPDAVRVTARATTTYLLAPGQVDQARTSVAARSTRAGLWMGTTVATVDTTDAALLNALAGGALGASVNLTAASWQALASGRVDLLGLTVPLGLDAGDVGGLLDHTWTEVELLGALADQLGTDPAAGVLRSLPAGPAPATVSLGQFVHGGSDSDGTHHDLTVGALDVVRAAFAAGESGTITVGPSLTVAGATVAAAGLTVLSPPVIAVGPVGSSARSAQATFTLTLAVPVAGLAGSPVMHVPVGMEMGAGTATLTAIDCAADGTTTGVGAHADTGAGRSYLGTVATAGGTVQPATVLDVAGLARVDLAGSNSVGASQTDLWFDPPLGIDHPLPAGGAALLPSAMGAGLSPTVTVPVLPTVPASTIAAAVLAALTPVLAGLDPVAASLQRALGAGAGRADVAALDAGCARLELVR